MPLGKIQKHFYLLWWPDSATYWNKRCGFVINLIFILCYYDCCSNSSCNYKPRSRYIIQFSSGNRFNITVPVTTVSSWWRYIIGHIHVVLWYYGQFVKHLHMIMDMYKHNNLLSEVIYIFLKPNDQVKQFHNNIRIMYNENISIDYLP